MRSFECLLPLEQAWKRTEQALFKPFDFSVWLKLGFLAWLANLTATAPGWVMNLHSGGGQPQRGGDLKELLMRELVPLLVLLAAVLLLYLAFSIAVLWIKSRGRFMFIDGVLGGVEEPMTARWSKFAKRGNGLFGLLLCWDVATGAFGLLMLACSAGLLWTWGRACFKAMDLLPLDALAIAGLSLFILLLLLSIVLACARALIEDFAAISMYKTGCGAWTALGKVLSLAVSSPLGALKYPLCLAAIAIVSQTLILAAVLATLLICCIGCILWIALSIPFVWAVVLLPLLHFKTAFAIEFAAQAGPDFDLLESKVKPEDAGNSQPVI